MVAVAVHLGGAGFGFLYYRMHWRIRPVRCKGCGRTSRPGGGGRRGRNLRVYREEERGAGPRRPWRRAGMEEDRIKAEMDAVLEKISRVGRENLTESDLRVLQLRQRDPAPPAHLR